MTILVVALYSKTTSKNAKHAAITDSSTIGTISNLGVQLFEHHVTYSRSDVTFPDKAIWLLQPMSFLTSMSSPCVSHSDVQALSWVPLIIKSLRHWPHCNQVTSNSQTQWSSLQRWPSPFVLFSCLLLLSAYYGSIYGHELLQHCGGAKFEILGNFLRLDHSSGHQMGKKVC